MLASVLQRVADGELHRVMVFMPPRHGKSELVSRLFPAYCLWRNPEQWVGVNSYGARLALQLSKSARQNYLHGGPGVPPGETQSDSFAADLWGTAGGGGLWAAGVGGPITGLGMHKGIIDDPLKNAEEARSEVIRENQRQWYQSTFYTREEPRGSIVVVQTRWNEDDLSGWLLAEEEEEQPEGWHIVCLPAIAEEKPREWPASCTVEPDWRQPGEALCPERYPLEKLERIKKRIGEYFWAALYQQRPGPLEGGMFPRAAFRIVEDVPASLAGWTLVRYWDKAGAEPGKGDWTVGLLMARSPEGRFWILEVARFQLASDKRNEKIKEIAALDRERYGAVSIWIEQPPGLAKESTEAVVRLLAGYTVRADPVTKDKIERADPLATQVLAGNVNVVKAPWNQSYLNEMSAFPNGSHDDQVDASSGAFNKLAGVRKWEFS